MSTSSRFVLLLTAVLAATLAAIAAPSPKIAASPSTWSGAVRGICVHALLFEGRHQIGTRAGAVAVARDIRASTARRVRRIRALQVIPPLPGLSSRWLRLERRLAAVYASSYLRIYEAIVCLLAARARVLVVELLSDRDVRGLLDFLHDACEVDAPEVFTEPVVEAFRRLTPADGGAAVNTFSGVTSEVQPEDRTVLSFSGVDCEWCADVAVPWTEELDEVCREFVERQEPIPPVPTFMCGTWSIARAASRMPCACGSTSQEKRSCAGS